MTDRVFEAAAAMERCNQAFAMVTITAVEGIVPRTSGRMLVREDGSHVGTIGGHHVEDQAVEAAVRAIATGEGVQLAVDCPKGRMMLMIDVVNRSRKVHVVGFGQVGRCVAETLYGVGYAIYVHDIRPVDCPYAAGVKVSDSWSGALEGLVLDECSALVVTVQGGRELLSNVDFSKAFYVGLLSSRSRIVPDKGISAPLGLDIGAETPQEVAISVAAEIMRAFNRTGGRPLCDDRRRLVIVRGAGDLASATIIRLTRAGYHVLALETARPTQVRRNVSFAEAVYDGSCVVDGMKAVLIDSPQECFHAFDRHEVPVLVDEEASSIGILSPTVVVDAVMAKKNLGTRRDMAPLVVALGPGFTAGDDADVVIETKRGHDLGRIITAGSAAANTGVPGVIGGYGRERVVHSSASGVFRGVKTFGDIVKAGDVIAYVGDVPQTTMIDGMVRGMLHDGLQVCDGFKIADIDPRGEGIDYTSPSDKARAIAGGVLEAVDSFFASFM